MIHLRNLHKQFGSKVLVQDARFHLRPGERVGLVGENGTGKTTLLRMILGREPIDAGTVTVRKGARLGLLEQELDT
ncbi:MAG: ATP-binding cassette domain-containing protein, partial [Nitrospinaceae bacterium]